MADRLDELEGLTFEEIIEENTDNSENLVTEEAKPEPVLEIPEKEPQPESDLKGLDILKEKVLSHHQALQDLLLKK